MTLFISPERPTYSISSGGRVFTARSYCWSLFDAAWYCPLFFTRYTPTTGLRISARKACTLVRAHSSFAVKHDFVRCAECLPAITVTCPSSSATGTNLGWRSGTGLFHCLRSDRDPTTGEVNGRHRHRGSTLFGLSRPKRLPAPERKPAWAG